MSEAVYRGFLKPVADYQLPDKFGMRSAEANRLVKAAMSHFLHRANSYAQEQGMTFHQRLAAFQNGEVTVGPQRHEYNDFFRYFPPGHFDAAGNPLQGR